MTTDIKKTFEEWKRSEIARIEDFRKNSGKDPLLSHLEPASKEDYEKWLAGYLQKGNLPSALYPYNFPSNPKVGLYVATSSFTLPDNLQDPRAVSVLVPEDIDVKFHYVAASNLYFMKDFTVVGTWIPVYDDFKLAD